MMKVNTLGELQSETQEELDALLPSVLRLQGGAFKGELLKVNKEINYG